MATTLKVQTYVGDAKTLIAFNLPASATKRLAGFTIQCEPKGQQAFYLLNTLQFKLPGDHAQDATEPATSSLNAPFQKFRWLHVAGSAHQGPEPVYGPYTYTVTARYFDAGGALLPLDPTQSVSKTVNVAPFRKKGLSLGFTRGYTQSQAFTHHFGLKAKIKPDGDELIFDTNQVSGTSANGKEYTYADEYEWLGFTARTRIFEILDEVTKDKSLSLSVFAYDLSEPDFCAALLALAKQGRVRVILDDAALHKSTQAKKASGNKKAVKAKTSPEDAFETQFNRVVKAPAALKRGHFARYSHDKVLIVSKGKPGDSNAGAQKVLTGSTNFSVTGLYVNSNHVIVFDDAVVAKKYQEVFEESWNIDVKAAAFVKSPLSSATASFSSGKTPKIEVTFSPHSEEGATKVLNAMTARIQKEGKTSGGSVLFAVMQLDKSSGPVLPALSALHKQEKIFSFGISDTTSGISLYEPGKKNGVLVTGKPSASTLPPPFDQVRSIGGVGHQVHHKFVVCGFNGKDPVVYCGSSNLALGGEQANGDNLVAIHDGDVATAFALDALGLVDHFQFLDRQQSAARKSGGKSKKEPANKSQAAASAEWFLFTTNNWVKAYYAADDLHKVDRTLFGPPTK